MKRAFLVLALLCVVFPAAVSAQALTSLSSLRVRYNTQKATIRPEGDLKIQIDEIDRQLAEASRLGRNGDVRRLLARGTTLLAGREWTDAVDFTSSLVLRTDRVVVDSSRPYAVRLEQIYSPSIQLERSLTAHAVLRKPPAAATGTAAAQPGELVKDLVTVDGVARDLRESPVFFDLDLQGVADGPYQLAVEVLDQTRSLGTSTLSISIRKGLDDLVVRLEAEARRAPEALRADILFPVDRLRNVNRGRLELRTFDPDRDFAAAEEIAAAVRAGRNPYATRTGDFKRHYLLASAGEIMPYRMYVPTSYAPGPSTGSGQAPGSGRTWPLIIALHGLGGTEDSFFTGPNYNGAFPRLAEQHGYIVAAPLGYRVDGSYGWGLGNPPADPTTRRVQERSEEDVMQVLRTVRQQYRIDENRIYLMGHSMGAIGTWKIAPKFPDIWAALGPFAGSGAPGTLERIRHIPQIVVHGDADPTVNVQGSRSMVEKMKELAIEVNYIEVPGGGHSDVVAPNLPAMFEFFNRHTKGARSTSQP
jgi:poly(3-hydroxybutyrate) depolymerase